MRITDLPPAAAIEAGDLVPIVHAGETCAATAEQMRGPDAGTITASWRWIAMPTVPPMSAGRCGLNGPATTATELYLARIADVPVADYAGALSKIRVGDYIWLQEQAEADDYARFAIAAAPIIDDTTVTVPIAVDPTSTGGTLKNNESVFVLFRYPLDAPMPFLGEP